MTFLNLKESFFLGRACRQFLFVHKFLWFEGSYFSHLDSKHFSPQEIEIICQKSKHYQSQVLNKLMKGVKKKIFLEKNHIVVKSDQNGFLTEISVGPNKYNITPLVNDMNMMQILQDKIHIQSLQTLKLEYCTMITNKTFEVIQGLKYLHSLSIVQNY